MIQAPGLILRDIHQPPAPPWWPPAPGWWFVLGALLLVVLAALAVWWRRRQRRHALEDLFDTAIAQAATPALQVAAMSELLRRAARRHDAAADTLLGEDWLRFLDVGLTTPVFSAGVGAALSDAGFRRDLSQTQVDALHVVTRSRFLDWMST